MRSLILGLILVSGCVLIHGCKDKDDDGDFVPIVVPTGEVDVSQTMTSMKLGREMHYSVYLPPGYNSSGVSYPVLYLLHGMWGNYKDWVDNGMASVMDDYIYLKKAKPMIVIMPDGLDSFYCNNYNNGTMLYEDFFIEEFIPYIESEYRILSTKNNRAIAGLSMGGYGSVFHAFKRQEMFGSCYSMSGALSMGNAAPDPKEIVNSKTAEELEDLPAFTMECGTEDYLVYTSNVDFDAFLSQKGITHTWIQRTGTHDWTFWKACLPKALEFASSHFSD